MANVSSIEIELVLLDEEHKLWEFFSSIVIDRDQTYLVLAENAPQVCTESKKTHRKGAYISHVYHIFMFLLFVV